MKKTILLSMTAGAFTVSSANAAVVAEDSFSTGGADYVAGSNLVGQGPSATGFTGDWLTNQANSHTVSATNLLYTGLETSGGSIEANVNNGLRNGRVLSTTYTDASVGAVYISFLMQIESAGGANSYRAFELHDGTLGDPNADNGFNDGQHREFQLGYHNGDFGTSGVGFRADNDNAFRAELDTARNLDVNLYVIKLDLSATPNSDTATVWMNPTIGGVGDPTGGVSVTGFDLTFDRITLARFGGDGVTWDELRVGDTFEDVTPEAVPEPSSTALLGLGGLALILRRRK